jgi:phosphopantothenate synthetase
MKWQFSRGCLGTPVTVVDEIYRAVSRQIQKLEVEFKISPERLFSFHAFKFGS